MSNSSLILIVEDDPDDLFFLKRSFANVGIANPLREVRSGREAIAYLNGDGPYADRAKFPFPGILLLDINMPDGDGFEVLTWIQNKLPVKGMLIIVLSRLDTIRAINRAYSLGANSFLSKPTNPEELKSLIAAFHEYWLVRNRPPSLDRQDTRL